MLIICADALERARLSFGRRVRSADALERAPAGALITLSHAPSLRAVPLGWFAGRSAGMRAVLRGRPRADVLITNAQHVAPGFIIVNHVQPTLWKLPEPCFPWASFCSVSKVA